LGEPYSIILRRDEGGRFSQATVREPRFNPYPSHPMDGPTHRRPRKTGGVRPGVGPKGSDAPPAGADTLCQGPSQAPQEESLSQTGLRLPGQGPLRERCM